MNTELTIVIPAKNEEKLIGSLLRSIACQSYDRIKDTLIILADAGSSDNTVETACKWAKTYGLNGFQVIAGGLPAVGRNAGAGLATSRYVLFVDADVQLEHAWVLEDAIFEMRARGLHLTTTDIRCPEGRLRDNILYAASNFCQRASKWLGIPFATGMFMLWDRAIFWQLGGFDEQALYAEDYMLSKRVKCRRFAVVHGGVETTNRRFRKMGIPTVVWLFFKTIILCWHFDHHFKKDQNYWNPF